jgi:hypothetical protein
MDILVGGIFYKHHAFHDVTKNHCPPTDPEIKGGKMLSSGELQL